MIEGIEHTGTGVGMKGVSYFTNSSLTMASAVLIQSFVQPHYWKYLSFNCGWRTRMTGRLDQAKASQDDIIPIAMR
jgi:hypothetical protein